MVTPDEGEMVLGPDGPRVGDTAARRKNVETTVAIRLAIELQNKVCPGCGVSYWRVTHTDGPVRYVKCRECGVNDKVVVS